MDADSEATESTRTGPDHVYAPYGRGLQVGSHNTMNNNYVVLPDGEKYLLHEVVQPHRGYVDALTVTYYEHNPLVAAFHRFLDERDRGYFAVEAEPGMGKSAFAAWVAGRQETDAAHFVQNGARAGRTATAVRSLGAQLIAAWKLDDLTLGGWLLGGSGEPEWLGIVIERAAARRDEQRPARPIVIVVDALEAAYDYPATELPFGLPRRLPKGVYVVATARNGRLRNTPADQTHRVVVAPDAAGNIEALDGFLHTRARGDRRLVRALDQYGIATDTFVAQVLDRSRGSWIYAHYVLAAIDQEPRTVCSLPELPNGLDAYYEEHVLPLCLGPDGQADERRTVLLAALGAAREPVDAATLSSLAGLDEPSLFDGLLRDGLRPFCTIVTPDDDPDAPPRYLPHHSSLREYLTNSSDPTLRRATRTAHARACDRYLTAWGGLDLGLGALVAHPELADMDGGYPVRHLVSHLLEAGREADAHRLFALSRGRENLWYAAHERAGSVDAFLQDVELAEAATERLGTRLRCRLIRASVTSAVTALPPRLVRELVTRELWTVEQAFHRVKRMGHRQVQAQALLPLIPELPRRLHPEALTLAAGYGDAERAPVLAAIIPLLDDALVTTVVEPVLNTDSGLPLARPLVALAARLPKATLSGLAHHPSLVDRHGNRAYVRALVALFRHPDRAAGARKALKILRSLKHRPNSDQLVALLSYLPVEEVFDEVLAFFGGTHHARGGGVTPAPGARGSTDRLERLSSALKGSGDMRVSACLLQMAAQLQFSREHAPALVEMALRSRVERLDFVFYTLVERLSTTEVRDWVSALFPPEGTQGRRLLPEARHVLLGALLQRLPPDDARSYAEAEMATAPEPPWMPVVTEFPLVWDARPHLVAYLSPETRRGFVERVSGTWNGPRRVQYWDTLARIGPHLSEEEFGIVLAAVSTEAAWEKGARTVALDALAPHLPDHLLAQVLADSPGRGRSEVLSTVVELGRVRPPEKSIRIEQRGLRFVREFLPPPAQADAVAELAPGLSAEAAGHALAILESAPVTAPLFARANGAWQPTSAPSASTRSLSMLVEPISELGGVARAVEALSAALPDAALSRAWAVAVRGGEDHPAQVALWAPGLVSRLISAGREGLLHNLLPRAAERIPLTGADDVVHFLRFADLVSVEQVHQAGDVLLARRDDPPYRAEALAGLSHRLPEAERHALAGEVLDTLARARPADRSTDKWYPWRDARALGHLYRAGATETATEALRELLAPGVGWDAAVLEAFGTPLPVPVVEETLAVAMAGDGPEWDSSHILMAIAPSLDESQARTVLRKVMEAGPDQPAQQRLLPALAERLEPDPADALSMEVLEYTLRMATEPAEQSGVISMFIPRLRRVDPGRCRLIVDQLIELHTPDTSLSWEPEPGFDTAVAALEPEELAELYDRVSRARNPASRAAAQAMILRRLTNEWPGADFPDAADLPHTWPAGLDRAPQCGLISASARWIRRQGGDRAVDEVVDALIDVHTWWP